MILDRIAHTVGLLALAIILGLALGFLGSAAQAAETGLVHSNVANFIGPLGGTSSGRTWIRATDDAAVLSCLPGTAAADCAWGKPAFEWRRFGSLAADALVNVCTAAIEPGPFAPPNRPTVDPNCGDPCGCGDALDKKANVLKSAVKAVAVPLNSTGVVSLTWSAPTTCVDQSDGVAKPCANPAYPTWAIQGYRILSGANGSPLTLLQSVGPGVTSLTLPNYGNGVYNFQVYAYNGQGEGARSSIVTIEVKKPTTADPKALPVAVEGVSLKVTFP